MKVPSHIGNPIPIGIAQQGDAVGTLVAAPALS